MIEDKEILKYFIENDYRGFLVETAAPIIPLSLVKSEIAFLLYCVDNLDQKQFEIALIPRAFTYFPELEEMLDYGNGRR